MIIFQKCMYLPLFKCLKTSVPKSSRIFNSLNMVMQTNLMILWGFWRNLFFLELLVNLLRFVQKLTQHKISSKYLHAGSLFRAHKIAQKCEWSGYRELFRILWKATITHDFFISHSQDQLKVKVKRICKGQKIYD